MVELPRILMVEAPPASPEPCWMTTPARRPRSRSETFWSGWTSATAASSTATELPISRTRLAAAVPVTTTSSSCSAWEARKKF
ncbi:MAG: hypothetical protein F4020_04340 [Gammaproteobacteria bacterium]|nr:hypothetical protein [Gammaproteobacteria bacterium]